MRMKIAIMELLKIARIKNSICNPPVVLFTYHNIVQEKCNKNGRSQITRQAAAVADVKQGQIKLVFSAGFPASFFI
jgi:hypothetical protein